MLLTHLILQVAALLSAALYARRRPSHRPLFWFLFAWTAATWACVLLSAAVPAIVRPADPCLPPLDGLERTAFCLYTAAQLAWPLGLAGLSVHLFLRRRSSVCIEAWIACLLFLLAMPALRGEDLRLFLLAIHLACLCVVAVSTATHYHHRAPTTAAHHCLLLCSLVEAGVVVAGPWRLGLWGQWPLALLGYSLLCFALACYQGVLVWALRRLSR